MSISGIGSASYSNNLSLLQVLQDDETSSTEASTSSLTATTTWQTQIKSQIDSYLSDIPKGDDGTLSFQDVDDYLTQLEEAWDETVKADLEALGVDPDAEYPLSYDPTTGKVTVSNDHPDKEVIDKYFEDNPDKVEEFETIIQIGKLTNLSNSSFTQTEIRQNIQQESMAWWYEDNSDPTSWFSGGGLVLGAGQTAYSGLNITV